MENFYSIVENYKNKNIEEILNKSLKLFSEQGLQKVSFNQIADECNIGVASLYRYFKNKKTLINECAIYHLSKIVEEIKPKVNSIQFLNKKAIEELEELLNYYIKFYKENKTFLKFLSEFDNYIMYNKMDKQKEFDYNQLYKSFYYIAKKIYKKGLIDNSIRDDFEFDSFYYSVSSALWIFTSIT